MRKRGDENGWLDYLGTYGVGTLVVIAAFLVAYQFVDPAPPRTIAMAAGSVDGAYHAFAVAYREVLAEADVELEIRPTQGSAENLRLLNDPNSDVELAFVQGGVAEPDANPGLMSLGSMFLEPIWVFHNLDEELEDMRDLAGLRVAYGSNGSGTRHLATRLLMDNGVQVSDAETSRLSGMEGAQALIDNRLDAIFLVAYTTANAVQTLMSEDRVSLMNFARADAYVRRYPFLQRVELPRGALDLAKDRPPRDIAMLAATAGLVARETLHPALIDLLLQAADRVHRRGGLLERAGQFPSPQGVDLPLSEDARRFYEQGPPLLQRYLPFWAATLVDRLKVMLLPLIAVLLPLMRLTPPLFRWRIRRRIYRWYTELREVDPEVQPTTPSRSRVESALEKVARIEHEVKHLSVPLSYADQLYNLRLHIDLVRGRLLEIQTRQEES